MKSESFIRLLIVQDFDLKIASERFGISFESLMRDRNNGIKQLWIDGSGKRIAYSKYDEIDDDRQDIDRKIVIFDYTINILNSMECVKKKSVEDSSLFWKFNIKKTSKKDLLKMFERFEISDTDMVYFYKSIELDYLWIHKETKKPFLTKFEFTKRDHYNQSIFKKYLFLIDTIKFDIIYDVDYILDKISEFGIDSLVKEEKEFLDSIK
jgi:hypothetical protein